MAFCIGGLNFVFIVILIGHEATTAVDPTPSADDEIKIKQAMNISSQAAQRCYVDYVNSVLTNQRNLSCTTIKEVKAGIRDIYKFSEVMSDKEVEEMVNITTFNLDTNKLKVFKHHRGFDVLRNSRQGMVDCLKVIAAKNETAMTSFEPFNPLFDITYKVEFGEKSRHIQTKKLKSCFNDHLGPQNNPKVLKMINEQFDQIISLSATYLSTYYPSEVPKTHRSSTGLIIGVICGIVGVLLLTTVIRWYMKKKRAPVEGRASYRS